MTRIASTGQHKKFIALVLAAALAITGFSAAPARADEDVARFIAGMALLGIIGAAINDHNDRHERPVVVAPHHPTPKPRPLPPRVSRYDLPSQCVKYFSGYSQSRTLVGDGCLRRYYGAPVALPKHCRVTFWNGRNHRTGYKPECLKSHGYRLVRR